MDYSGGEGGGGAKAMLAPSQIIGDGGGAGLPSSYAYANKRTSQVKLHTAFFCWQ